MQVIESSNIFYNVEKIRQAVMTALNVVDEISAVI